MAGQDYLSQFGMMRAVLIVGFFAVATMLYNLTVSIYDNYQIEEHIAEFEQRNAELAHENTQKLLDLQYYTSEEYREKIAKQNLGLVHPGEEVIVIPNELLVQLSESQDVSAIDAAVLDQLSNPQKWLRFFFGANPYKS